MPSDFDRFMAATIPVSRAESLAQLDRHIREIAHELAVWRIRREAMDLRVKRTGERRA